MAAELAGAAAPMQSYVVSEKSVVTVPMEFVCFCCLNRNPTLPLKPITISFLPMKVLRVVS